jgi:hypothetical protein
MAREPNDLCRVARKALGTPKKPSPAIRRLLAVLNGDELHRVPGWKELREDLIGAVYYMHGVVPDDFDPKWVKYRVGMELQNAAAALDPVAYWTCQGA